MARSRIAVCKRSIDTVAAVAAIKALHAKHGLVICMSYAVLQIECPLEVVGPRASGLAEVIHCFHTAQIKDCKLIRALATGPARRLEEQAPAREGLVG